MLAPAKLGESSQAWRKRNLTGLINKHFVPNGQWTQAVQPTTYEGKDENLKDLSGCVLRDQQSTSRSYLSHTENGVPLPKTQKDGGFLNYQYFQGSGKIQH